MKENEAEREVGFKRAGGIRWKSDRQDLLRNFFFVSCREPVSEHPTCFPGRAVLAGWEGSCSVCSVYKEGVDSRQQVHGAEMALLSAKCEPGIGDWLRLGTH